MPDGQVLEFSGVTKRFGAVTAVSDFSARVEPGVVTGFLGPNGAGKTTSLRILLGLVRATGGTATIGGVPYRKLPHPLRTVGAALEASSFHPGRTAANHLKAYAQAARIPLARVDESLATVGLADVAGRKVGGFSLGMRQRLGLAYTLLGDPGVLVLDEPANGLDPEGIKWMRGLLRQLAREGRTVLVSSHLLAEVQQTVDALLIIADGRLVFQGALDDLSDPSEQAVVADSPDRAALAGALRGAGLDAEVLRTGLMVRGAETIEVGAAAASAGVPLSLLHKRGPGLEEIFLELVSGERVYAPRAPASAGADLNEPEAATGADQAVAAGVGVGVGAAGALPAGAGAGADGAGAGAGAVAAGEASAPTGTMVLAHPVPEPVEGRPPRASAVDAAPQPSEHLGFAVASTGIISVISSQPAEGAEGAGAHETEQVEPEADAARVEYAVASTGIISIVPVPAEETPVEAGTVDDPGDDGEPAAAAEHPLDAGGSEAEHPAPDDHAGSDEEGDRA